MKLILMIDKSAYNSVL